MSGRALVIAYGNPLREDDGVAWEVARLLESRAHLDVRTVHQLVPELAWALSDADSVVFVDACRGGQAGRVREETVVEADPSGADPHSLDPARLLGLCHALYGRVPRATLVSIAGARFGFGDELSEPVRRAVPAVVRRILAGASAGEP
ncbi:MAG TPA: hydrogenase maturation protease, partial [Vicinamibacteria bacterium]|nr:hydrogenase maturation protease [Vicinamibacteria bacterium]